MALLQPLRALLGAGIGTRVLKYPTLFLDSVRVISQMHSTLENAFVQGNAPSSTGFFFKLPRRANCVTKHNVFWVIGCCFRVLWSSAYAHAIGGWHLRDSRELGEYVLAKIKARRGLSTLTWGW